MAHEIYSQTQNMARELGLQLNDTQRLLLADAFAHAFIEGGKKNSHFLMSATAYLVQRKQGEDVVSTPGSDSDFT